MNKEKEPPSSYSTLLLERRNGIVQISLNRPEKLNALNSQLQREFALCLEEVSTDRSVRAVILTGKGRGFCAGLDLKDFGESFSHVADGEGPSIFALLEAVPHPVIAAINGPAVTGGLELALACDILIASRNAVFADTHAMVGVPPGAGLSQKLSRIIGLHRALSVSLTGDFFNAEQAAQWGLVQRVTDPDNLLEEAWQLAENIAKAEPWIVQDLKRLIREGASLSLADGMRMELDNFNDWARNADREAASQNAGMVIHRHRDRSLGQKGAAK
jgi:enoyl-CoA hydratase